MPIPKKIAYFNKHFTNRLFIPFAGWIPPFAIIEHFDRKSGHLYRTPILAFPICNCYVFALTYGRDVDWVKNLQASGCGILKYNRCTDQIHNYRFYTYEDVKRIFPGLVRSFLEILHVTDCLMVEKQGKTLQGSGRCEDKTIDSFITARE